MNGHGKVEHRLPNGDVLVHDSTERRPEVDAAFKEVNAALKESAAATFRDINAAKNS